MKQVDKIKEKLSIQFTDIGEDENRHLIGNCKFCGGHGVLINDHVTKCIRVDNPYVTIQSGALSNMVGQLIEIKEDYSTIQVGLTVFKFGKNEYKKSTFEELFNKFILNHKLIKFDELKYIFTYENGFALQIINAGFSNENTKDIEMVIYDYESNIIAIK